MHGELGHGQRRKEEKWTSLKATGGGHRPGYGPKGGMKKKNIPCTPVASSDPHCEQTEQWITNG